MKIYNVYERVTRILFTEPETRNSDELLISKVDIDINPRISKLPYFDVMANRRKYGLPTCESIRRARQKAQEKNPELQSNKRVRQYRKDNQAEFEEFARS